MNRKLKKVTEETRKSLEEITGNHISYHEEILPGGKRKGVFMPTTKLKQSSVKDDGHWKGNKNFQMANKFKNKLQEFQEGVDYTYDESKKTYTIYHEKLKNAFWGDASNEVEYKAIEDSNGNIQFRKSAIFRSSKARKEKNLRVFPEEASVSSSVMENNRDNFREPSEFKGVEEEFGYYKEWKGWGESFEEPTNTVYHRKREGGAFVERKRVWKDNDQTSSSNSQIAGTSDSMEIEIEGNEKKEIENSRQSQAYYQRQMSSNSQCTKPNFLKNEFNPDQSKLINYVPYVVGTAFLVGSVLVTGYFLSRKRSN